MADLNVMAVSLAGLNEVAGMAPATVTVGDTFLNDGRVVLVVTNASGGSINAVVDAPGAQAPEGATSFDPDVTVAVPAGQTRRIGPFPPNRFNDSTGKVKVTCSAVASVTVGATRLPS